MIQLLTIVVIFEGATALFFTIDTHPIKKLVKALDQARNKFFPVIQTLAGAMFVILLSSIASITKIQTRSREVGAVTPTDQILLKTHMLEACLMGYALFLGVIIDRIHCFLRKIDALENVQSPQVSPREGKAKGGSNTMEVLKEKIAELRHKLHKLSVNSETMEKEAKLAEETVKALEEQAEGFLLKYDCLMGDNQNLKSQLPATEKKSSNPHSKKDA